MMNFLRWLKGLVFILLALPFLVCGAAAVAIAIFAGLIGLIGIALLWIAGIVKIDGKNLAANIQKAVDKIK